MKSATNINAVSANPPEPPAALPSSGFLSSLLVAVLAYHSYLGTIVIVEDYVTSTGTKIISLLLLRFAYVLSGGACIFAILRVAFGFSRL